MGGRFLKPLIVAVVLAIAVFSNAYAVSQVSTANLQSGQIPSASTWNTNLNYAANWINTNLLGSGNTFTIANGESLLVNGTIVIDTLRLTGWGDLAAHITPRASRTYRIGLPTRLLAGVYADTVAAEHAIVDTLTVTFPDTMGSGKWGRANIQTGAMDSTKIPNNGVSYANQGLLSVDSLKVRAGGISGSNLASSLSGRKNFTSGVRVPGVETDSIYSGASNEIAFKVGGIDSAIVVEAVGNVTYLWLQGAAAASSYFIAHTKPGATGGLGMAMYEGNASGSANNMQYEFTYDAPNNRLRIFSADTDGASADADVVRIPDGGVAINGNGSFVDNQFDFVCPACSLHYMESGFCKQDGARLRENDDAQDIANAIGELRRDRRAQTALHRYGVLVRDADGWEGVNFQKGIYYSMSAIRQVSQRLTRQEEEIAALRQERAYFPAYLGGAAFMGIGISMLFLARRRWA